MVADWQDPASLQSVPAEQGTHEPRAQTALASHDVPSVEVPVGTHVPAAPLSHETTPVKHAPGEHVAPETQTAVSSPAPPSVAPSPTSLASARGPASAPPPSPLPIVASGPVPPSADPVAKSPRSVVHDREPALAARTSARAPRRRTNCIEDERTKVSPGAIRREPHVKAHIGSPEEDRSHAPSPCEPAATIGCERGPPALSAQAPIRGNPRPRARA
jgi:hypothetical protein